MKILLITEFFPNLKNPIFSGGVEARMFYVARYLAKKHQVTVLAQKRTQELGEEVEDDLIIRRVGFEVKKEEASLFSLLHRLWFLWLCIYNGLEIKVDIVEGSNYVVFLPTFLLGIVKGIPKISWYPDVLKGQWKTYFGSFLGMIGEWAESIFLKLPWDQVITISEAAKAKIIKAGVSGNKVVVVPCGVELKSEKYQVISNNVKKKQCIVVSRLVSYKRVDWAINLLLELGNDYSLVVVGKGPEFNSLKLKVKSLKLEGRVLFRDSVSQGELYQEIQQSALLLHPSLVEGFGIVLVEAAALGTPFVAADIPTSMELEESLQSGKLFKQDEFNDFVKQVKMLLQSPKELNALAENGRKNVRVYDWEKIGEETERVISAFKFQE